MEKSQWLKQNFAPLIEASAEALRRRKAVFDEYCEKVCAQKREQCFLMVSTRRNSIKYTAKVLQ